VRVAEEFLRHAVVARAVGAAHRLAVPLHAVVVDVVGPWQQPGAAVVGDRDALLLHVRVPPHDPAERRGFLDGPLAGWLAAALAPFAGPAR
jgi:hypothetical protein